MSRTRSARVRRRLAATVAATLLVATNALPVEAATDPARGQQWGLDVIGAEQAWATGRGAGVVIAVVDSGVDLRHEDLADKLVPGIDIVDGDRTPQDGYGHGTHVAGIAAAATGNGRGIAGVAPDARIMPVRVLGDDGSGSSAGVVEGIRWAVDNGADVVNLSLGQRAQQVFGSSLVDAIRYAWSKGVVVVVAAGNEFVLSSGFTDEPAIVVSATTRGDRAPDYSNGVGRATWGIAAPGGGCELLTCPRADDIFSSYWSSTASDTYAFLAGTSMAAPHVAGAAAVLLSLGLSPQQTVDRLLATAEDIGPSGRDSTFGSGRLDVAAAVRGLGGTRTTTPAPPTPTRTESTGSAGSTAAPTTAPSSPRADEDDETATDGRTPSPSAPSTSTTTPTAPTPAPSTTPVPTATAPTPTDTPATPGTPAEVTTEGTDDLAGTATGVGVNEQVAPSWLVGLAVLLLLTASIATGVVRRRR